jgi:predicted DsbA family dithiol-disulfide isomerase
VSGSAAADPVAAPRRSEHITRVSHAPSGEPPTLGPSNAPVQVELFFLPGAANTRLPYQLVSELWQNHPNRIRVLFRVLSRQGQFNLPNAALEAAAQGKFFEFMNAVHTRLRGALPAQIREVADSVALDLERLDAAWLDGRHHADLEENERRRTRLRARQIPEVVFSGRLAARPVTVLGSSELEAAYQEAYARALDVLDRGVAPERLADTLTAAALAERPPYVIMLGPSDERSESDSRLDNGGMELLSIPVDLRGLPSSIRPPDRPPDRPATDAAERPWYGSPEPTTRPARTLPVVVACNPLSVLCYRQLQLANTVAAVFEGQVRVLWAPIVDPRARDAATVTRAADAVLCAESLGFGWSVLDLMVAQTNRRRGRTIDADRVIDDLIAEADLDRRTLASCLAIEAGNALNRSEALRRAGVTASPTLLIGGRMYPGGLSDIKTLQAVIEDQFSPGWIEQLAMPRAGEANAPTIADR